MMNLLLCYAHPREGERVRARIAHGPVLLGVGKVEATLALTRALSASTVAPDGVILFGVCGAYPGRHGVAEPLSVGELCLVSQDRLADEGVCIADGFLGVDELGLADGGPFMSSTPLTEQLAQKLGVRVVRGNTVSACSGSEASSKSLLGRYPAEVETMEGAAVARVCREWNLPLVHLRCVSNETGERERGSWDLEGACANVQDAVLALLDEEWASAWRPA